MIRLTSSTCSFLSIIFLAGFLSTPARGAGKVSVVCSLPNFAAIARSVGGERVDVFSIGKGSQDPHYVDPKPSFMVKLRNAGIFCLQGLEMEVGWVPPLLQGAGNPNIMAGAQFYVDCSAGIPVLEQLSGEVTRAEGDLHPYGNPHYELDPLNGILVANSIAGALKRKDPTGSSTYDANLSAFAQTLYEKTFGKDLVGQVGGPKLDRMSRSGELDGFLQSHPEAKLGGWMGLIRPIRQHPIVTYHKNFSYFVNRFGLQVAAYIEPKPGVPPSPGHLVTVVEAVRSRGVKLIATQPYYNRGAPDLVASKTGAKVVMLPSGVGQVSGVDTYFELFDYLSKTLAEAGK